MSERKLSVRQVRSEIGFARNQRATLRGLGLRRIGSTATVVDTPETRGMLRKVRHLVQVQEEQ